jgi:hypothetical protein
MESKETPIPIIAYLMILDKSNQPVISRNYLCDHLELFNEEPGLDIECIRMQISMIAYSMLDVFDEKERLVAKASSVPSDPFKSFLGLL